MLSAAVSSDSAAGAFLCRKCSGSLALSSIISSMVSGQTFRSLVHGLGLDISVEIEVRFRESNF